MTIFLIIAKENLISELTKGRDNSISADKGYGNVLLSSLGGSFGWGRDQDISSQKQSLVDECIRVLKELQEEPSDQLNKDSLTRTIEAYEKKIKLLKPAKFDTSNIGIAIGKCYEVIRKLKTELETSKLLDIQMDDNPLNKFRLQMAYYIWKTVKESTDLAEEKKAAVRRIINECLVNLDSLDRTNEHYNTFYKKTVLRAIDDLRRANAALCDNHSMSMNIPLSITLGATVNYDAKVFTPSLGELEEYCFKALRAIEPQEEIVEELTFTM